MTAQEIRNELANRYDYEDARKVCCYNCKYWGLTTSPISAIMSITKQER